VRWRMSITPGPLTPTLSPSEGERVNRSQVRDYPSRTQLGLKPMPGTLVNTECAWQRRTLFHSQPRPPKVAAESRNQPLTYGERTR
jgi:hypothetical protein